MSQSRRQRQTISLTACAQLLGVDVEKVKAHIRVSGQAASYAGEVAPGIPVLRVVDRYVVPTAPLIGYGIDPEARAHDDAPAG